jgi:hypothetical protein
MKEIETLLIQTQILDDGMIRVRRIDGSRPGKWRELTTVVYGVCQCCGETENSFLTLDRDLGVWCFNCYGPALCGVVCHKVNERI